jgi:hypothetical protein
MQPKIHENAADKQRAYRQRLQERLVGLRPEEPAAKPKRVSRPERLAHVIVEVQDLADGYQSWLDAMPENQAESDLANRLRETIDLFQQAAEALDQVDPPRGFGR